jgi:hypothetical protein
MQVPGIVDQHIDLAEPVDDLLDRPLDRGGIGDVGGTAVAVTPSASTSAMVSAAALGSRTSSTTSLPASASALTRPGRSAVRAGDHRHLAGHRERIEY